MKKIIYSFVIMIAAGSLFTSCVTNTEPQGVKDLREAKADYLASLSKLREADAELVKAQAATEQARAAYRQALVTLKEIEASIEQAKADTSIAGMKAAAEIAAVRAQQALAEAQQALEIALKKIEAEALSLTADEQKAITAAVLKYNFAQTLYNKAYADYVKADSALFMEKLYPSKWPSAEYFEGIIAKAEENIATQNAKIATAEGLKEEPQAVKDSIEKWEEVIKSLEVDKVNALNAKRLYEADSLKEANKAYKAAHDAFEIPEEVEFAFVDEDGDAVKYPLTNGWGLDRSFKSYVEAVGAPEFGIEVVAKNILVGITSEGEVADTADLNKAVVLVGEVISALNRELVVVNDSAKIKGIETLKKAAEDADSTYKADRAILEAGLEKYAPYIKAKAVKDSLVADTLVAKAVYDSAAYGKDGWIAAVADTVAKKGAIATAEKSAIDTYNAAVKKFFVAVKDLQTGGWPNVSSTDSAAFIAAVKVFGTAQAALYGKQDTLTFYEGYDFNTGKEKIAKYALSELLASGFVTKRGLDAEGGQRYATAPYGGKENKGWYFNSSESWATNYEKGYAYKVTAEKGIQEEAINDPFVKVLDAITGDGTVHWFTDKTEANFVDAARGHLIGSGKVFADSAEFKKAIAKSNESVKAAIEAFEASKEAEATKHHFMDSTKLAYDKAVADVDTVGNKGITNASNGFGGVYKKFWAVNNYARRDGKSDDLTNWNEKTFTEPENCVTIFGNHILENNTIKIILKQIDSDSNGDPNESYIFKGYNGLTEFAQKIKAQQIYELAKNYRAATEQLENINKQYAQIVLSVAAAEVEFTEANEARTAALKELCGVNEDGVLLDEVDELSEENVDGGKWNLGGKQLEWAEQYATNYPAIVKAAADGVDDIKEQIKDIKIFLATLESCYVQFSNVVNEEHDWSIDGKWGGILTRLDNEIELAKKSIKKSEATIANCEKAIQRIEAGFDPESIEIERLQAELELAAQKLEEASQILAIAQSEYEAVIKKYGVNE